MSKGISYGNGVLNVQSPGYQGQLLHLPRGPLSQEEENDITEEVPMAQGLSGFLVGIYPDQVNCSAHNNNCYLQLILGI